MTQWELLLQFTLNVTAAAVMGAVIGLERQVRHHSAGLRTNALVCAGAAMFVALPRLLGADVTEPAKVATYVVSGVGFLGGGVILREGLNIKGLSTAATLWCSAAVGSLAGAGFVLPALVGTAFVLAVHLALRPIGMGIDARQRLAKETHYRLRVVCEERQGEAVRAALLREVAGCAGVALNGVTSQEGVQAGTADVGADLCAAVEQDAGVQALLDRVAAVPGVKSVGWKKVERQPD
jgi:putative Mg2+ transporter-C (MgtC) family protein